MDESRHLADRYQASKSGKLKMDNIDPYFMEAMARVLEFGNVKHGQKDWQRGLPITEVVSAIERHTMQIKMGFDIDDETGFPHAIHIACNCMYLAWYLRQTPDYIKPIDNRTW